MFGNATIPSNASEPLLWHLVAVDLKLNRYYLVENELTTPAFLVAWLDWQEVGDADVFVIPWPADRDLPESLGVA